MIPREVLAELDLGLMPETGRPISGVDTATVALLEGATGPVLVKATSRAAPGMFPAEASGLQWLTAGGLPTPAVLAVTERALAMSWIETDRPNERAARQFGRTLARLHSTDVDHFGEPPAATNGWRPHSGWLGAVPIAYGHWSDWSTFYAQARLLPLGELAHQSGGLSRQGLAAVRELCAHLVKGTVNVGGEQAPTRIHGDLWAGNLLWDRSTVTVIDPAASGGHPETDLGMLLLFPPPHLTEILAGYQETRVLDNDWQQRVPLHQILPLLVHAAMFGGSYGNQVERETRTVLRTLAR